MLKGRHASAGGLDDTIPKTLAGEINLRTKDFIDV
jgi:hypothetical protein